MDAEENTLATDDDDAAMSNLTDPSPIAPPPAGWTPNIENPSDAGRLAKTVVMAVFAGLTTLFFVIRVCVRAQGRKMAADDWTCTIAFILLIIYVSVIFTDVSYGMGYHAWEVRQNDYIQIMKWLYAGTVIYSPLAYITKVTLLLMTARVFDVKATAVRAIYIIIAVIGIIYIPLQIVKIMICIPIASYWDPQVPSVHCMPQSKLFYLDIALALVTDTIILIIPIPLTWNLRMPWRRKLRVIALLGLGGIAVVTTVYRAHLLVKFETSEDITTDFLTLNLFGVIEISIGIICSCLPSCNILVDRYRRRRRRSVQHNQPPSCWIVDHNRPRRSHWMDTLSLWGTANRGQDSAFGSMNVTRNSGSGRTTPSGRAQMKSRRLSVDVDVEPGLAVGEGSCAGMQASPPAEPESSLPVSLSETTCRVGEVGQAGSEEGVITIRRTVEISTESLELSRIDPRQEWTGIWDGTMNSGLRVPKGQG